MPIFEYECRSCGEVFEYLQSSGETNHGIECPKCKSQKTGRIFSTFATTGGSSEGRGGGGRGGDCGPSSSG